MIVAVNKCNIIGLVLTKLNKLYWGFSCEDIDDKILDNYKNSLTCDTLNKTTCFPDNCVNETVILICDLQISGISFSFDETERIITFFIPEEGITNGLAPYSYKWTYEIDDFDQAGTIDTAQSTLALKENKQFDVLVTAISVEVTDANGCKATKNCYFVEGEIQCAEDYQPCSNVSNFVVRDNFVRCIGVSGLLVSIKE